MLTGESQCHISTPPGDWNQSLMMGSKRVDHWTSGTLYECSEIAGSPQGSPSAADYVCCEAGRRTCSKHETGTEELCEIKWDYHIGLVTARDEDCHRWGHNDQSRWGHQCSETTLIGESRFHISTPPTRGLNLGPSWWEANRWTTGPVELCMNAVKLQALHITNK